MQTHSCNTAEELLQEISTLEVEIMHLERHLLSMYRTAFGDIAAEYNSVPDNTPKTVESQEGGTATRPSLQDHVPANTPKTVESQEGSTATRPSLQDLMDNDQINTYISHAENQGYLVSPDKLSEDIVRCMTSIYCKLASNYSTPTPAATPESANNTIIGFSSSSSLSPSLLSPSPPFSAHHRRHFNQDYSWEIEEYASSSSSFSSDYFQHEGEAASSLKRLDTITPYTSNTVVVSRACLELVDESRIDDVAPMMKKFRLMLKVLEDIDPRKMEAEQKLAFWINIYNALVMHAHLDSEIHHQNHLKSRGITSPLLQKEAAYNVGGHITAAHDIRSSILGCSSSAAASRIPTTVTTTSPSWLQTFFTPAGGIKLKNNNNKRNSSSRHIYSLDDPEPLVYFALSSGACSDPAVRVYTSKNIFAELNIAKQEFIQAATTITTTTPTNTFSLSSLSSIYNNNNCKQKHSKERTSNEYNKKVILPKVLYYFANDACLNLYGLTEMVHECLSESQQKAMELCQQQLTINSNKQLMTRMLQPDKYIQWSPYNSAFRYIIQTQQL